MSSEQKMLQRAEDVGTYYSENAPSYIAHWVLKSVRTERMLEWYQKVFDAKIVSENKHITFLTFDGEHHRIAIIKMPKIFLPLGFLLRFQRKFFGLDHIAFHFDSLSKLLHNYERIKKEGVTPVWCINHGPTTSIYYEDPDGNRLEFQFENFRSLRELQTFASTGKFNENPIGVTFDPEEMLRRWEAGIPEKELTNRDNEIVAPGKRALKGYEALSWKTL